MGYAMAEKDVIEPDDFISLLADEATPTVGSEDDLYNRMAVHGESFWEVLHAPFLERDLNRRQLQAIIRRGLREANGCYRKLLPLFSIADEDYHKLMDFLRHQRLKP
jgi:hypothetical protein